MTRTYSGKCPNCDDPMLFQIKTIHHRLEFYAQGIVDCPRCGKQASEIHTKSYSAKDLFLNIPLKPLYQQNPEAPFRCSATCTQCGRTESFPLGQWYQPGSVLELAGWKSGYDNNTQQDTVKCPQCIEKEGKTITIDPGSFTTKLSTMDWGKENLYNSNTLLAGLFINTSQNNQKMMGKEARKMMQKEIQKMMTPSSMFTPKRK